MIGLLIWRIFCWKCCGRFCVSYLVRVLCFWFLFMRVMLCWILVIDIMLMKEWFLLSWFSYFRMFGLGVGFVILDRMFVLSNSFIVVDYVVCFVGV